MRTLKRGVAIHAVVYAVVTCLLAPPLAAKTIPPELKASRVTHFYHGSEAYAALAERYKKRQLLERLSAFLAPVRIPQMLALQTKECGELNMYYSAYESRVTICYEYLYWLEETAAAEGEAEGVAREEVVLGGLIGPILHEAGHAVFDILRVPVLGREEDAADQFATYILLSFGSDVVKPMIRGMAHALKTLTPDPASAASSKFADEHGTASQRFYNTLCLAYGRDRAGFEAIAAQSGLPAERLKNCENEYNQVDQAFSKTIKPNIDDKLMQTVRSVPWLLTEFDDAAAQQVKLEGVKR